MAQAVGKQRRWGAVIAAALVFMGSPALVFADRDSVIAALQAQCEADREAKIKPLRDMEIAKCKLDKTINDPNYCERYWASWGDAVRGADGTVIPRKFDDLPSCVAACKARQDRSWK